MKGICKFCGQEKELIDSHIIPKCFYQIKTRGNMTLFRPSKKLIDSRNYQNGQKEPLLCAECDNKLGILDGYANKILFHKIPEHEFKKCDGEKTYLLKAQDFNYDKLHKFFISLAWRSSVSSERFSLGKYEDIALKILKGEIPDDESLFLPLIYRKNTGTPLDQITGFFGQKFLGKKACRFRFPNYEIILITNTKDSNDINSMNEHKCIFNKNEISVVEITTLINLDSQIAKQVISCRDANRKKL